MLPGFPSFGMQVAHLRRYQEIARVLLRHGFDSIVDQLGLRARLSLPRRISERVRRVEPLSSANTCEGQSRS